jgi:FkbM family methyltransferase
VTSILRGLGTALGCARVFQSPGDVYRYFRSRRRYVAGERDGAAETLRLRSLGGASIVMRASQDVWTLKHTFLTGFHRPPRPLGDDPVILDLGSNVGYTVADLAHRFPRARILGVEMDARNLELARRNTAVFGPRVQLVHAAVWHTDGVVEYDPAADDDAFAVRTDSAPGAGAVTVPARSITSLLDEAGIDRVDYVKMDIEGAEGALLDGDVAWLDRVDALKIEIHPPATSARCREVLEAHGFRTWQDAAHWDTVCAVRASSGVAVPRPPAQAAESQRRSWFRRRSTRAA